MHVRPVGRYKIVFVSFYILIAAGLVGLGVRVAINVGWQLPAPVGDSVLFASATFSRCALGVYETPIFPLDPSGEARFIWHGLLSPAVLYGLVPSCDIAGMFLAHSVILVVTAILAVLIVREMGACWSVGLIFALTCVALQSKVQFRPEAVAILFSLVAEYARRKWHPALWAVSVCTVAWAHPTAGILYAAFAFLSTDKAELLRIWKAIPTAIVAVVVYNGIIAYLYPFPLGDLFEGLLIQGRNFAQRNDGEVTTYFLRSDFFPLFGPTLLVAFALLCLSRPAIVFLLPLVWFYVLRVPPAYYNGVPLLTVLLYRIATPPIRGDLGEERRGEERILVAANVLAGVLAVVGLWQANARDINSIIAYGVDPSQFVSVVKQIQTEGMIVCGVPAFFALLDKDRSIAKSYIPRLAGCSGGSDDVAVDLVQASGTSASHIEACTFPFARQAETPLGRFFRSDSGYSFYICPAGLNGPGTNDSAYTKEN